MLADNGMYFSANTVNSPNLMNSYILLRNNKESRPMSLDDLKHVGLKSTDLIWVECQSVCWQHPHEIKELRTLVAEAGNLRTVNPVPSATITNELFIQDDLLKGTSETPLAGDLADETGSPKQELKGNSLTAAGETEMYKYGGISSPIIPGIKKIDVDTKVNYSLPNDEINELYVKKSAGTAKFELPLLKTGIQKHYKKAALYVALVASGALIMLLINNNRNNNLAVTPQNNNRLQVDKSINEAAISDTGYEEMANKIQDTAAPTKEVLLPEVDQKSSTGPIKKTSILEKPDEQLADKEMDKGIVKKNNHLATEVPVPKKAPQEILSTLVSVKANNYGVGSFGGIRNLQMTLQNDSKYVLDMVTVELKYLNPEGIILKTEQIHFKSIQPGTQERIAVNKSKRGVKIEYAITKIESNGTTATTAGL